MNRLPLVVALSICAFCLALLTATSRPADPEAAIPRRAPAAAEPVMLMAVRAGPAPAPAETPAAAPAPESRFSISGIAALPASDEEAPAAAPAPEAPLPRPLRRAGERPSYRVRALVTAYCPCRRCCGRFANGRTSTDTSAWQPGAATDPDVIPYGSTVAVPGYGTVRVDDTGLAMRRSWRSAHRIHIDVRFDYHWQARRWGSQLLEVEVTPPAR